MKNLASFLKRFGIWIYLLAVAVFYIGSAYLDSTTGLLVFALASLILIVDPVILLLENRSNSEKLGKAYYYFWGLAAVAIALFFIRQNLEVPLAKLAAGEGAFVARLRLVLLFLFIFSLGASLIMRLMLSLSYGGKYSQMSRNRQNYLRSALASIFAVVPALIILNYITVLRNPVIDFSGRVSFGEKSSSVISSIDSQVRIYAFLPEAQQVKTRYKSTSNELMRIAPEVRVMLEQLPVVNGSINLEFLNADLATFDTEEFASVSNGTIVLRVYKKDYSGSAGDKPYTERKVYVYTQKDFRDLERKLTRSLVEVASPRINVYFAALNGERIRYTQSANKAGGLQYFKEQLQFYNATVRELDANHGWPEQIPAECDVLFLMGPSTPYGAEAQQAIFDYIKKGGNIFVALDPAGREDFSWFFEAVGGSTYTFSKDIISNVPAMAPLLETNSTGKHRITERFSNDIRHRLILLNNSYFNKEGSASAHTSGLSETQAGADAGIKYQTVADLHPTEIFYSNHKSYHDGNRNRRSDKGEQVGRKPIALAFSQPGNAESPRVLVFAGVDWLTDLGLRGIPLEMRNREVALDAISWMRESPLIAEIVPEKGETRTNQVTDGLKLRLFVLGVAVFPLLVSGGLAFAIALYRRRRRFIGETAP